MKFLIHSNGPNVSTGYGVQTALLASRLHRAGHDVAVSCTYGQQGSLGSWPVPDMPRTLDNLITLYPAGYEVNGNDIIHNHAQHHFGGDERGGWIITLLDVWALHNPLLADFNVAAWCPVDHYPVPPGVLAFFRKTGAVPIAMSRFGERLLHEAGLGPAYIPLTVDTKVMKPTPTVQIGDRQVTGREYLGIREDAFAVGMVAMNKGWARDRKGFNEAFRAFAEFRERHHEAVLYLHCDAPGGAEGMDLRELAVHAGIPEPSLVWVNQYAYRVGFKQEQMAAMYSALDVLLAPSHGEGFCVPLIEAQACGTPVIASAFSAQPELVGAGWLVAGQFEWDPAQHASYLCPSVAHITQRLEEAYEADRGAMASTAVEFAGQYDADLVFEAYWKPFLASLEPQEPAPPSYEREPMVEVAVIVPLVREENLPRLIESFEATNDGTAWLYLVHDRGIPKSAEDATERAYSVQTFADSTTFAEKVNAGFLEATEPWVLIVGDDVELKPGWLEAARKLSTEYDVIGTNDSSNGVKNPDVAAGKHADHFFVRRAYVEAEGACLDGPGVLAPEAYKHWFTDREIIDLAKARRVFTPCLDSVVEHHHPGYSGREDLRSADPVYMKAVEWAEGDAATFRTRSQYIDMQRVGVRR